MQITTNTDNNKQSFEMGKTKAQSLESILKIESIFCFFSPFLCYIW